MISINKPNLAAAFALAFSSLASASPVSQGIGAFFEGQASWADFADILRDPKESGGLVNDDPIYQNPLLTAATRDFGPSIIQLSALPIKIEPLRMKPVPWSSWYYPSIDKDFFKGPEESESDDLTKFTGENSILGKYDRWQVQWSRERKRTPLTSARAIALRNYNSRNQPWEGLCDAWAIASIYLPEPKVPVNREWGGTFGFGKEKITFSVSDLKALLLMTFDNVDDKVLGKYGMKNLGNEDSYIYPDIYPEQFHRFVEKQIFELNNPFIMDYDPGVPVWTVPVYGAAMTISAIPGRNDAVSVRTVLYWSGQRDTKKDREKTGDVPVTRAYTYILKGKPGPNPGSLEITGGEWTDGPFVQSRHDHPDYMISLPAFSKLKRGSRNPGISVQVVDELIRDSIRGGSVQ